MNRTIARAACSILGDDTNVMPESPVTQLDKRKIMQNNTLHIIITIIGAVSDNCQSVSRPT